MSILPSLLPGVIAGGLGALSSLTAKKPSMKKIGIFSPEQRSVQNQILGMLQGQLGQGGPFQQAQSYLQNFLSGSPEATQAFEAPLMRQFHEQIIPSLLERFTGFAPGAKSSSAFQQALGQAGAGLTENLAALRAGLGMQSATQLLGLPQTLFGAAFQSPFSLQQRAGGGAFSNALGAFGSGLSPGLGQLTGFSLLKRFFPNAFGSEG